jgi:Leucine-rich repeat (LRR) protein
MENYASLKYLNLMTAFEESIQEKVFYFNKVLEVVYLGENGLNSFPKFCQFYEPENCNKINKVLNLECKLREIKFDSNNLKVVSYTDLIELTNLEYLNLEANKISYIELNSFSNLINMEILILSSNNLTFFDDNLFSPLANLKFLKISFNQLETIQSFLFDGLFKLEKLDLSLFHLIFCLI